MRRIAVVGDGLSSAGHVLPYEQQHGFSFHGHKTALIGGEAYCQKRKSVGLIAKACGPYRIKYGTTREAALDPDIVLSECPTPPRIIARLAGESWCEDRDEGYTRGANRCAAQATGVDNAPNRYDQQFTLTDANGRPVARLRYRIRVNSTVIQSGVTDAGGRTPRIRTDDMKRLYLDVMV